ncbi:SEC-C domain-containing protein [Aliivibrio fischeri]|uniref:SEC-C domain-containing protein n=1 Tax=Aliivibrio fischeri TaxID=668 RepID=UPI00080D8DF0|nr:SEC-C domain-containing protein [Aliivibrio fischeri]OCH39442.1 hypothetical protein A6D99_08540 [Aliivibrio fischeri]
MKIGRNEKCWCDSGKKYKHCHYGRDKAEPISKGEAIGFSKKNASRKCCYAPVALHSECSKMIINAHTISKSGSLLEIADKTNHVLGLKLDLANIFKNKGKFVPERIGVNQASTFKGFCSVHDKALFSCLEDKPFIGSEEQFLALMYRALAKELYAKEASLINSEFIKGADKGKSTFDQIFIQGFAANNQLGIKTAIKELSDIKVSLDAQLLGDEVNELCHLLIESSSPMPIAVSSISSPISDFNGEIIQNLGDLKVKAESVVFNSFSSEGRGYVVFSWLKNATIINKFIHTMLSTDAKPIFSKLVRFFIGSAENVFISPEWWETLSEEQKGKIEQLIMTGINPFEFEPETVFLDDGIDFGGWDAESIRKINF